MSPVTLPYAADGLAMAGQFFVDPATPGPRPAVLVFPEAFGLGDYILGRAARLAGLGYAVLACDLHGAGRSYDTIEAVMPLIGPLMADPARTRARARGALDALLDRPEVDATRIAAIGYCFGGTMALELARDGADLAAVVGFHAGLATAAPDDARQIGGRVLMCVGADDPAIPPAQRAAFEEEMRRGGVDWEMALYGGDVHGFTNPAADRLGKPELARYDARADARSWAAMLALFDELGPIAG